MLADLLFYGVVGRALVHPKLRGDNDLIAYRSQRLTDENLIMPGAIAFRRVKVGAAELMGIAYQSNRFFPIRGCSVTVAEAHASKANSRNFDIPEQTRLHVSSLLQNPSSSARNSRVLALTVRSVRHRA